MPLTYNQIIEIIQKEKGLTYSEIKERVEEKLKLLSGMISRDGALYIIANELGVNLYETARKPKADNLNPLMRNIEFVGKVVRKFEPRTFKKDNGEEGQVCSIIVSDETGSVRMVAWTAEQIKVFEMLNEEEDIVQISNGYVKDNNGLMEVHLGSNSKVIVNPPGVVVKPKPFTSLLTSSAPVMQIKELQEKKLAKIRGTVVQVFEPRTYLACQECNRKLLDGNVCEVHGKVEGKIVPVVNLYFDDGTDTIRVTCFRETAEILLKCDAEHINKLKDNPEKFKELQRELAGMQLEIVGRPVKNQMMDRLEFNAQELKEIDPKVFIKEFEEETIAGL